MPAGRRLFGALLAFGIGLVLATGATRGGSDARSEDEAAALRLCLARIALFDEIVISRFDYRLLAIEPWQLEEAEALRRRAEANCTSGRLRFGIGDIEQALILIGVPPSFGSDKAHEGRGESGL